MKKFTILALGFIGIAVAVSSCAPQSSTFGYTNNYEVPIRVREQVEVYDDEGYAAEQPHYVNVYPDYVVYPSYGYGYSSHMVFIPYRRKVVTYSPFWDYCYSPTYVTNYYYPYVWNQRPSRENSRPPVRESERTNKVRNFGTTRTGQDTYNASEHNYREESKRRDNNNSGNNNNSNAGNGRKTNNSDVNKTDRHNSNTNSNSNSPRTENRNVENGNSNVTRRENINSENSNTNKTNNTNQEKVDSKTESNRTNNSTKSAPRQEPTSNVSRGGNSQEAPKRDTESKSVLGKIWDAVTSSGKSEPSGSSNNSSSSSSSSRSSSNSGSSSGSSSSSKSNSSGSSNSSSTPKSGGRGR